MDDRIAELTRRISDLEQELEIELARRAAELRLRMDGRRIAFEEAVAAEHLRLKTRLLAYLAASNPWAVITAPVIYAMIVPFALIDVMVSIYQAICFPAYGIPRVRRSDYIVFDRERLGYLNLIEKINCAYCSYANGVVAYVREIAGRTEQYWCPIKHARRVLGAHPHYAAFTEFGDAEAYHRDLEEIRRRLADVKGP